MNCACKLHLFLVTAAVLVSATPFPAAHLKSVADKSYNTTDVSVTPEGFELKCPLQKLEARVAPWGSVFSSVCQTEGQGDFSISPRELVRSGRTKTIPLTGSVFIHDESKVLLERGPVTECFSAGAGGIRQDFIIADKVDGSGPLKLFLNVKGAECFETKKGIRLQISSGRTLAYGRLYVTDAEGKQLEASMKKEVDGIAVTVFDKSARYPLIIDPTISDADWEILNDLGIPGANHQVRALVYGNDGTLYAAGSFTAIGKTHARGVAQWDGSSWRALGDGLSNDVYALALDSNGTLYAGGSFNTSGEDSIRQIAMWDGVQWNPLRSGIRGGAVRALLVDRNGDLYAGGSFTSAGDTAALCIAKWDGESWSEVGGGMGGTLSNTVNALAQDDSGNVYAAGAFFKAGETDVQHIAKWNGSEWSSLGTGLNGRGYALACRNNILYAGGYFTTAGDASVNRVAQWDGSTWSSVGSGLGNTVYALVIHQSGAIFAGGDFSTGIALWNGVSWTTVGSGLNGSVYALASDNLGNVCAGGYIIAADSVPVNNIALWNNSGWKALGTGPDQIIRAMVMDKSNNLIVGGDFSTIGNVSAKGIALWDGSSWQPLGTQINGSVYALALDSAGTLYAGGQNNIVNRHSYIGKWDGNAWTTVGSRLSGSVSVLTCDKEGNLYAGGVFSSAGGNEVNRVAKWDGQAWSSLGNGLMRENNPSVNVLYADDRGNVYAGGNFTYAGDTSASNIARWDGTRWYPMGTGCSGSISSITGDKEGNIYAGGSFASIGGVDARNIAKWDGESWSALGNGTNNFVRTLEFDAQGNLYAGGNFDSASTVAASCIARWDGNEWEALGSGADGLVWDMLPSGPYMYVCGSFFSAGGKVTPKLTRVDLHLPTTGSNEVSPILKAASSVPFRCLGSSLILSNMLPGDRIVLSTLSGRVVLRAPVAPVVDLKKFSAQPLVVRIQRNGKTLSKGMVMTR